MKLDKNDVHLLFASAKRPDAHAAPSRAAAPAPAAAEPAPQPFPTPVPAAPVAAGLPLPTGDTAPESAGDFLAGLKKASITMWRKLGPNTAASRKEQRARLLELLQWFCKKNGLSFEENASQAYLNGHTRVQGRLHACISRGQHAVAVEVCFALEQAALLKLRAAHLQGRQPLLLWMGTALTRTELLARVAQATGNPVTNWLELVVLTESAQLSK